MLETTAVLAGDVSDDHALRDAAMAVGRIRGSVGRGLAVVRQDEIVTVAPLPQRGTAAAVASLRRACADLQQRPSWC